MSRNEVPWSCFGLAKISKVEWTDLICTGKGWRVQIRDK